MICFVGFIFGIQAQQNTKVDSLRRPSNFEDKVAQFRMFPNDTLDVIFLGNSITAGTQWNELLDMDNAVNRGISGDTTYGVLERLDEITEGRPAKIFILLGINDLARNISNDIILRNYSIIIDRIQKESPSTQIYVQTLLPVNSTFKRFVNHYSKAPLILKINRRLRKMTEQKKVNLIDLHSHFLDKNGKLDIQYTNDGLHLTAMGYRLWALLLKPYL
ncbi:GDSL-type esterase/lipase family protein [Allomuricauda sp. ARW1Y1]|jgi:lysophospholipase L1-like esterase|uniref:GDSL-type esterase/lipase family protein n=1 Tax=Allomuricauda sp. ARW1Y1 TaxID=2663843 RepID=UPI0018451E1F|nr:GDSL-type esterase/lipase family protein [Muricauda sp. ARW1Y1]NYJ27875.1 lysophospholipase L1-like esterase [Muricauda sp. ARW1Y1]